MSQSINNNTNASQTPNNNNISPLEDGGSSAGLTQGEIIFVTLACFIVTVAAIFAIYVVHRKRRQRAEDQKNNDAPTSTQLNLPHVNSTELNEMGKYPTAGSSHDTSRGYSPTGNHRPTFESEDSRMNRRRDSTNAVESQGSSGKTSRRSSMGSTGSNVSNQYKVAAMDKMRRMSEVSDL